jgi:putative tricarboxylic transport membrane protein
VALSHRGRAFASGLLLVAVGAFAAFAARHLAQTTGGGNMGAGRFPVILAALLVVLGVAILAQGFRRRVEAAPAMPSGPVPWRGIALLTAAFLFFALTVRPLGLGPSMSVAIVLSCLASRGWRPWPTFWLTVGMVAFGWLLFVRLLGLPIPFLGTWFR